MTPPQVNVLSCSKKMTKDIKRMRNKEIYSEREWQIIEKHLWLFSSFLLELSVLIHSLVHSPPVLSLIPYPASERQTHKKRNRVVIHKRMVCKGIGRGIWKGGCGGGRGKALISVKLTTFIPRIPLPLPQ